MRADLPAVVGIDVGGTFTDCIAFDGRTGETRIAKLPTSLDDQSRAVVDGVAEIGLPIPSLHQICHGTTTATNALIERKGAKAAFVGTRGFRDIIVLGGETRENTYGLTGEFIPLVPRRHRLEVGGRIGSLGEVLEPLTEEHLAVLVGELSALDVDSVAICLMHAYANDSHERQVEAALKAANPSLFIARSTAIYPEIGEFERSSTATIAAYIGPVITRYFQNLDNGLRRRGFGKDYMVVQSNGGAASHRIAQLYPTTTICSGPAAGVRAASAVAQAAGLSHAVTFDMGGTSADVCVIVDGKMRQSTDNAVGYRMPLQVPMIEIATVGAGGGSIAAIDDSGILTVGPHSAGARPGPACYGHGGTLPTVTDAHFVLGHIPAASLAANRISTDEAAAVEAIRRVIAGPLGISVEAAAEAILEVVSENMAGTVRLGTVERGLDVRHFALIPYGGAGPLHACALMRKLDMPKAALPIYPGLTSALGAIMADVRHDFVTVIREPLESITGARIAKALARHREEGAALLAQQGIETIDAHDVEMAMLYQGQRHSVRVKLSAQDAATADLAAEFAAAYADQYGAALDLPVTLMSIASIVSAHLDGPDLAACADAARRAPPVIEDHVIDAQFQGQTYRTRVLDRRGLRAGDCVTGPAILVQRDTTILIEPGFRATDTDAGSLIIERESQS